jgi:predicted short-subunit dehydrogenase-like oxidoreductase (DUF2520 family)
MVSAAANAAALDPVEALTGPVARGDVATVQAHLEALARDPALAGLYRSLARELLRLPLTVPADARERLEDLLKSKGPPGSA